MIKILHLSDVHFGCNDADGEQDKITKGIAKSLKENSEQVDLIVFTGDLTQEGSATQFQKGKEWLDDIHSVVGGKIIFCPGNHDLKRKDAETDTLRLAYPNKDSFGRSKVKIYANQKQFTSFKRWANELNDDSLNYINLWKDNVSAGHEKIETNECEVGIIGINTALLSCGNDDEGKLCVDIKAINACIDEYDTKKQLVISIGHHPLDKWLTPWNEKNVRTVFEQECGVHLYLHGHLHESSSKSFSKNTGKSLCEISAGAAYQGSDWDQAFSVIAIDLIKKTVTPKFYCFNNDSGRWDYNASLSRPITTRLPSVVEEKNESLQTVKMEGGEKPSPEKWDDPFDNVASNSLSPYEIPKLFVDENNFISRVSKTFDSVIEGQRGTGKTMLLRYLSIDVQAPMAEEKSSNLTPLEAFKKNRIYSGIYTRLSGAGFNRSDLEAVDSPLRREAIFNHRLALFLISSIFTSLVILTKGTPNLESSFDKIKNTLKKILRSNDLAESKNWTDLAEVVSEVCNERLEELDEHLASLLPRCHITPFNPWLSLSGSIKTLLEKIKRCLELNAPFYLLLDDFDSLSAEQQTNLFKVARERNHSLVCYKFGVMTLGLKTSMAGDRITYKEGDDYDRIHLQWHDKGLSSDKGIRGNYNKTVEKIAQKRIDASNWPHGKKYKTIFNTWTRGNEIRNEVKLKEESEYNLLPEAERSPKTFSNYWSKQGDSHYFRHLRKNKIEHRYAGSDALVEFSSGIFRQFLEINSRIVSAALDVGWNPEKSKKIGPDLQSNEVRIYSEDMLRNLGETAGDTSSLSHYEYEVISAHLINLTNSLIGLFSNRLYGGGKDGEVISIAIKGNFNESSFGRAILDVAVRESILQRREIDYSSKTHGEGKLPTFSLNKRLVPKGRLGLKMQGRYELDLQQVELAAKDSKKFGELIVKKSTKNLVDTEDSPQERLL
jgi:predicted MPP superfamily phosphohydrolase/Cdc6-like AAA superfamily ATPase